MAKILIVEDDTTILNSYTFVLSKKGYDVIAASSGKEAIEALATSQFDLIILDMLMPEMSGIDFLRKADLAHNAPKTKILVLTNTESGKVRDQALKLGVHEYMLKVESTPYEVADKLESLLGAK